MNMFLIPSFYAHLFNGLLLVIGVILFILHYKSIIKTYAYKLTIFIFIFSIDVGVYIWD
jgi:hypothetical protein